MKNKLIAVSLLMVAVAILVRVGIVRANAGTITEVCKTNGGILMTKENCPGGSEKWTIGGGGGSTGSGVVGPDGKVVYMNMYGEKILKKSLGVNNEVVIKQYNFGGIDEFGEWVNDWKEDIEHSETMSETLFDNIFQWYGESLITKTGEVYRFENGDWVSKPFPTQ